MGLYTTKVYYPTPNRRTAIKNSTAAAFQSTMNQPNLMSGNMLAGKHERGIASHKLRIQNQLEELGLIKKVPALKSSTNHGAFSR